MSSVGSPSGEELVYVPLVFGFVTYARADRVQFPCRFLDLPSAGAGPVGAILGGAGLAVSADERAPGGGRRLRRLRERRRGPAHASSGRPADSLAAGRPGTTPELDRVAHGFFSGTAATIEQAWVRPRERWYPAFQREGGRLLNRGFAAGEPPQRLFEALDSVYRECVDRVGWPLDAAAGNMFRCILAAQLQSFAPLPHGDGHEGRHGG